MKITVSLFVLSFALGMSTTAKADQNVFESIFNTITGQTAPVATAGSNSGSESGAAIPYAPDEELHHYRAKGPCFEIYRSQAMEKRVQIHVSLGGAQIRMTMPADAEEPSGQLEGSVSSSGPLKGSIPTKVGCFQPWGIDRDHHSRDFHNAPMHDSVFFCGGEAVHVDPVNVPSHGCVHVDPNDGDRIFAIVEKYGVENTAICIDPN